MGRLQGLELETGTHPPEPLTDALHAVAPRPLLITPQPTILPSARWRRRTSVAGPTARFWLARTGHTQALQSFPRRYEQRVLGLFEHALVQR